MNWPGLLSVLEDFETWSPGLMNIRALPTAVWRLHGVTVSRLSIVTTVFHDTCSLQRHQHVILTHGTQSLHVNSAFHPSRQLNPHEVSMTNSHTNYSTTLARRLLSRLLNFSQFWTETTNGSVLPLFLQQPPLHQFRLPHHGICINKFFGFLFVNYTTITLDFHSVVSSNFSSDSRRGR